MAIINNTNNIPSLIFTSELNNYQSQSVHFCLPIHKKIEKTSTLIKYLRYFDIHMPFSSNDEVLNIKGNLKFPYLEFDISKFTNTKKVIVFELLLNNYFYKKNIWAVVRNISVRALQNRRSKNRRSENGLYNRDFPLLKYIGKWKNIDKKKTQFILLNPVDLNSLNKCYLEYNLIPIGGSLNFALKNIEFQNIDIRSME